MKIPETGLPGTLSPGSRGAAGPAHPHPASGFLIRFCVHTPRNDLRRLLRAPLFLIVQFPVAVYCIIDCARDFQFPLITVAATGKDLQASLKV